MKQTILIFIFALLSSIARSQFTIPLSLISTAGDKEGVTTIGGKNLTVEWTLGETFIGNGSANGQHITIGEQQSLPKWATGIEETIFKNVKLYPNPANAFVSIENLPEGKKNLFLTDVTGRKIQTIITSKNAEIISTSNLLSGNYLLLIQLNEKNQISYKLTLVNN